ncbi:MAG: class I SAM-dependent methyltransferase [Candidatus Omnitrophica bacterium]|nr:class I SAM-dependent methyltransferase [Candidatus Omnitrophota bacterium]
MKKIDLMRPKKLYEDILSQREADAKDFFARYSGQFVEVKCPACGADGRKSFNKYGFNHKYCSDCQTLYCSPRPDDTLLKFYYNNYPSLAMWTKLLLEADIERKKIQYTPRAKRIIDIMKRLGINSTGTAVDIGAGSGAFAACLKKEGFFRNIIALDLSNDCVGACKRASLDARLGTVDNIDPASVALISINDLIEHLFEPIEFLISCNRALETKGFISIATPNGEGFDFKILKEQTKNITPPEHLNYFNPVSLARLLERAGFEPVSVETPGELDVDIILKERKSGLDMKTNEFIDYLLGQDDQVLRNFQKFLSENRLSSHMLVVARKSKGL